MCLAYAKDFPIKTRVARYHNVYGPQGTWKGGREKAPAAFCRKAITSTTEFEMWGDGEQTRSFMFIDDCVEGSMRIMNGDYEKPIKHIPGPQGVRGRNSDNTLIKEALGWAPSISIKDGIRTTCAWIKSQVEADKASGVDIAALASSKVV